MVRAVLPAAPHVEIANGRDDWHWCRDCQQWSAVAYWRWEGYWHLRCTRCDRYIGVVPDETETSREMLPGQEEKTA